MHEWKVPHGMRGRQIVLHPEQIGIFTVPKCCSRTLVHAIKDGIGEERWESMPSAMGDAPFLWEGHENYRKVAFVRHPVARFLSAHAFMHSAAHPGHILQQIAAQKDEKRDQHYRSQASFLTLDGELLPTEIYRVESLPDVWPFDDWPIQHRNKTPAAKAEIDEAFKAAIVELFADDLKIWERAK